MKKFLALFLAILMLVGVFAGCAKKDEGATVTLEQAKDYLYNVMKDKNGKEIPNDYDVVGKIIIDGVSFDVTWATDNDNIKVKESSKANMWTVDLPDVNESVLEYKLTATIKAADGNTITVTFTPKIPVINNTGVTTEPKEGVAYKLFFEQVNLGYTLYALNTTQDNNNKFINSTLDPKAAADFYVEKVDGGYKIYTTINGVKNYVNATAVAKEDGKFTKAIGFATESESVFFYDAEKLTFMVTINGQTFGVGTYNAFETISISENTYFKNDNINVKDGQFPIGFMESAYAVTLTPDEKPVANDPAKDSTLTIAQAIELGKTKVKDQYTEGKYYVTGQIKEIQNDTYGNLVITDGTNSILVYGTFDATGAKKYGEMETKPVVGDTITVYGIIGMYNDAQIKNAWITNVVSGNGGNQGGTVTPPADDDNQGGTQTPGTTTYVYTVVDAPVAGTAYKFGMVQPNAGSKTYYLKGGMSGFYMATSENVSEAIDVYLEATTGGYYLYTMDGTTKLYINMVVSADGKHVNGAYEATAKTVYTYDATSKTIIAVIDEADYWFGTRNDKDYTTVGPCKTSYEGFYCNFYEKTAVTTPPADDDNQGGTTTPPADDNQGGTTTPPADDNQGGTTTPPAGDDNQGGTQTPPAGDDNQGGTQTPPAGDDDQGGTVTPPATGTTEFTVIDTPAPGTAYKFGMVQENAQKTVYLKGGMDGYYMATSENVSEAIDVYLEETTGGYYLYTTDGTTKLYINMVVSADGEHVNGAYAATASTVYTYDSDAKTIIAVIDGEDYWFGTRNDETYTTVGPCKTSYEGFYCNFYGEVVVNDDQPPVEDEEEVVVPEHTCVDIDNDYACDFYICARPLPPAADSVLTVERANVIAAAMKKNGDYTTQKYFVSGLVIAVDAEGNLTIRENGNTIVVNGVYDAEGNACTTITVGDTVELYGVIGKANNTPEIKDAVVKEHEVHTCVYDGLDDADCDLCGADNPNYDADAKYDYNLVNTPVVGKAYKFGMVHGNLQNKLYYINGSMSSYYFAATDNAKNAINVYLEETEGGYYLYTMDGVDKVYINMVVSGSHVNAAYETEAKTVYTYNATSKTVIAKVNGTDYWFAADNRYTYTTVGANKKSYNGFACMFYEKVLHEHDFTDVVCSCGVVDPDHTEHTYIDGECVCGAEEPNYEPPQGGVATSVTKTHTEIASIAGVTAGQNTGVINNKNIALNEDITIVCSQGTAGTAPTIYAESIRLYQNGALLTVKAAEGCEMTQIVITLASKSGGQGPISVTGGTASALSNRTYTITVDAGVSEVVIKATGTDKNSRLYVAGITVNYTK